ncbi:MAG: twin-arginine translocase subunit TatC [Rhodospirillaceae bacterium]|nr:twin-arginine translocase subunit TatC [Rhodospirillaceae bacterium]MBT4486921.1 twin-arginine translocase subunit TatC [Rhodospirillaceae bacterium]MBT5195480.1 twin-arginine translocase subunit TatC [Rhodospirillaceae bacterium]MBT5897991.1 twin-arginine translocase subunit TatC [Rhodospirillaceae bacterium]MBT6429371.1 twin-arginine translocase subunit TatC [Rhodospirillaceae bacterium]
MGADQPADDAEGDDVIEDEVEAQKMPLIQHLVELRNRLLWSIGALVVGFVLCYLVAEEMYTFLVQPLADLMEGQPGRRMIYTALHEAFFTQLKVAFFGSVCLTFPIVAGQLWAFVAPGLYKHERRAFLPFLMATPVLFLMGASLVYYLIFPLAWQFFMSFETAGGTGTLAIVMEPKVNEYLALVMKLIFAFGLSFQLPVVLMLMARAGMVSSQGLAAKRKYAVVITFAAAALLTPPDIISQVGLGIPILLLYEISIIGTKLVEKKRAEREASE